MHSGSFGGAVPNPVTVLARMVARLHDENGHVTLPGYYDKVIPLTDRERELLARLPFDETGWLADAQSGATFGEAGFTAEPFGDGVIYRAEKELIDQDDQVVSLGETHYLQSDGWVATRWINVHPEGYTEDVVTTVWG